MLSPNEIGRLLNPFEGRSFFFGFGLLTGRTEAARNSIPPSVPDVI